MIGCKNSLNRNCARIAIVALAICTQSVGAQESSTPSEPNDPYLWLEDTASESALSWARTHNAIAKNELEATPGFAALQARLLDILDSDARIPYVHKQGAYYYNFWRDALHMRGIWRRTSMAEYHKAQPAWETVLDLDALAKAENENWVWRRASCLRPRYDRCLIELSRGGSDAVVVREFDLGHKLFVTKGFVVDEAKTRVAWIDRNHVYIGSDFGRDSLTASGYPRMVKRWQRGTPLARAPTVFQGKSSDVSVTAWVSDEPGYRREFITRTIAGFAGETFLRDGQRWYKLNVPPDVDARTYRSQLLIELRHDWKPADITYPAGALLAINLNDFIAGKRKFQFLFEPSERNSLISYSATRKYLLLNELDNIRSKLYLLSFDNNAWTRQSLPTPEFGVAAASAVDEFESDDYFFVTTDFLTPTNYYLGSGNKSERVLLKQLPGYFDVQGLAISQHEATSKDGTRVPYFQVASKELRLDSAQRTLLTGYGGFEIARTPEYNPSVGAAWLERGGVYVLANIRGGGEFGPKWHQAALKEKRQNAYDDFIAVAEDLIARKVTSPKHLGIIGGSNGGLLVGVMLTQRPDLFGAVVCQSPLLDMRRYNKLLAGASWMAEYGDPDRAEDWNYIGKYSPYQNLAKDRHYPRILFTTSTRDDRVHPGHARKMAALMLEQGHDVLFYENTEGGHAGAANNAQQAYVSALAYAFLLKELQ